MDSIQNILTILYVENQELSTAFYQKIFSIKPDLNVPGMTEFNLAPNFKLGLMPNKGIAKILVPKMPHPDLGNGIPRCELYFRVNDLEFEFDNAVKSGAQLISPVEDRNWGEKVCYFSDLDGHIIAFAQQ